jgi:hypothetical protein
MPIYANLESWSIFKSPFFVDFLNIQYVLYKNKFQCWYRLLRRGFEAPFIPPKEIRNPLSV